jgi:UDP-N-acetylmuramoyl-L-alanyl-D-glutamate--2,6-diaminopimelate ligase
MKSNETGSLLYADNENNLDAPMDMKLSRLIQDLGALHVMGTLSREVTSIASDSRKAQAGSLFVSIRGHRQNGDHFIGDALAAGATSFITETEFDRLEGHHLSSNGITAVRVPDSRLALSKVSAEFYRHPSSRLNLIGITGTNGKTTLTYILEALFGMAGQKTGVIGTINYRYGGVKHPASVTTPESLEINRMLNDMAENGVESCFMEVSSHSLNLKRVHAMSFKVGVFTNLSQDHLDFHGSMESYIQDKKDLFRANQVEKRVLNIDDPVGREILNESSAETLTIGIHHPADITAKDCVLTEEGSRFTLQTPSGNREIFTHLLGTHNIYNLLSGAAVALFQGISLDDIDRGMRSIDRVPGRFEQLRCGQDFGVVVDYAHTDDALKNALHAARAVARNRVLVVFGCGGDRDPGKRPKMGKVAIDNSALAIITSDNPRSEDPGLIIRDIQTGIPETAKENQDYVIIQDRAEAIEYAIGQARPGDLLLIAGKGHEDYQVLSTGTIHFDDREVAEVAIKKRLNID